MAWRRGIAGVGAASCSFAGAAYFYRPEPSGEVLESHSELSRRIKSSKNLADDATKAEPLVLQGARATTLTAISILSKVLLLGFNTTRLVDDERYASLVELVRDRPEGEPLLTVANHASTLDDPAIVATMLPWDVLLRPSLLRWSICAHEICFETPAISAFFGSGKVLPIERGAGVDQKLLLDFSRKMAAGGWCHIFPEGKTVQTGTIGGRAPPTSAELGLLKWGVGKMIAHAPRTPRVVPFFHTGMQNLVAEDPATKDVLPGQPQLFNGITIRVGDPVEVADLLAKHEDEHGPLWKYSASSAKGGADDEEKWGCSSLADRRLYVDITRRVEAALLALEAEARSELGSAYPTVPRVVASGEYLSLLGK